MKKFFSLFLAGACLAAAGCGSAPDGNTKSGGGTQVLNLYLSLIHISEPTRH